MYHWRHAERNVEPDNVFIYVWDQKLTKTDEKSVYQNQNQNQNVNV